MPFYIGLVSLLAYQPSLVIKQQSRPYRRTAVVLFLKDKKVRLEFELTTMSQSSTFPLHQKPPYICLQQQ